MPERFHFSTQIQVQINHINYGGHLGNDSVLSIVHEARIRLLKSLGYTEKNIEGVGIIMVDAVILYKSEAFQGDRLDIDIAVRDLTKYSCDFFYRLTNELTQKEIARVKTTIYFFDYGTHRKVRIPEKFKKLFSGERSA